MTAALTLVPPFLRPGQAGVLAHLMHLAALSPVPVVVYDIPYRTAQHVSVDTWRRLAQAPGIAGAKYACGGITDDTVALLADLPGDFAVLCGEDAFLSPLLAMGAHGGILASAHVATQRFAALIQAWRAGDPAHARMMSAGLSRLSAALFAEPNPSVIKAVLHATGRIPTATVRLPLVAASPGATDRARRCLRELAASPTDGLKVEVLAGEAGHVLVGDGRGVLHQ